MMKVEWVEVHKGLLEVPLRRRSVAWKKAVALVEQIVAGKNGIAPDTKVSELRYDVECSICKKEIKIGHDYVFTLERGHAHYDCGQATPAVGDTG